MATGTVTGEVANVWFVTHAAATAPSFTSAEDHSFYGMGEFSLSLSRGSIEHDLIGVAGNYFDQGTLSMDGSFMLGRFGASANSYALDSIINGTGTSEFVAISGQISPSGTGTSAGNYIHWYLVSCQITGYDITMGDADAITEASVDFVVLDPDNIEYTVGKISDSSREG